MLRHPTDSVTGLHELADGPFEIDVSRIIQEWEALAPYYDVERWELPLPVWARRSFSDGPDAAWEAVDVRARLAKGDAPLSAYVHVPFCSSKCGFCDSYSFALISRRAEHIDRYLGCLVTEISRWSELGQTTSRPVTTVHLGGGTPTQLGRRGLQRLSSALSKNLATGPDTEWALETTGQDIDASMLATLHELGYRRLHVGVQTLEDGIRTAIGRRMGGEEVLERIERALARGWVVSVDLICGLPLQRLQSVANDIERLIELGVHGFSVYELLIYRQNRRWAHRHGLANRRHIDNYLMFQAGAYHLASRGYTRNLFNHWSLPADENLYFTFPSRGEDLLAVGTLADGVIGDYHYRHPRYSGYISWPQSGHPPLQGGLRRTDMESRLRPLVTAILAGSMPQAVVAALSEIGSGAGARLVGRWQAAGLVATSSGGALELSDAGSWFAGNMVNEVLGLRGRSTTSWH